MKIYKIYFIIIITLLLLSSKIVSAQVGGQLPNYGDIYNTAGNDAKKQTQKFESDVKKEVTSFEKDITNEAKQESWWDKLIGILKVIWDRLVRIFTFK